MIVTGGSTGIGRAICIQVNRMRHCIQLPFPKSCPHVDLLLCFGQFYAILRQAPSHSFDLFGFCKHEYIQYNDDRIAYVATLLSVSILSYSPLVVVVTVKHRTWPLQYAAEGANVVCVDIDAEQGKETLAACEELSGDIMFISADMCDNRAPKGVVEVCSMFERQVESFVEMFFDLGMNITVCACLCVCVHACLCVCACVCMVYV